MTAGQRALWASRQGGTGVSGRLAQGLWETRMPMTKVLTISAAAAAGLLLGWLLGRGSSRDAGSGTEATARENTSVRIEPVERSRDSNEAHLVVEQGAGVSRRWRIGGPCLDRWSDVPVNRSTAGEISAYWVTWRMLGGTGLGLIDGAVVWFPEGTPVCWQGSWIRTEAFGHPTNGYEYRYATELLTRPSGDDPVRLLITVDGQSPEAGGFGTSFICCPRKMTDGSWRFVATKEGLIDIEKLLSIDCLSGVHEDLRRFQIGSEQPAQ